MLKLALKDLELVEADKDYSVMMEYWHQPESHKQPSVRKCRVCLAGAVLAKTLGVSHLNLSEPGFWDDELKALVAIDFFRIGVCSSAFQTLGLGFEAGKKFNRQITLYSNDKEKFKAEVLSLAEELEQDGY